MNYPPGRARPLVDRSWSVAVFLVLLGAADIAFVTSVQAGPATVKTFDRITYTEPRGFEPAPMGSSNHVSFRRVDSASWILFSVYGSRATSKHLAAEFKFDWNDLNADSGIEAPHSRERTVGVDVAAREGGIFVPNVGFVDLLDVDVGGRVVAIIIECGSEDQFHSYQRIIGPFLDSLVVNPEPAPGRDNGFRREPVANATPAPRERDKGSQGDRDSRAPVGSDATAPHATTHDVDYVDDGFVWTGADGLEHVPALTTVGSGAGFPRSIPGVWQDDHQQFTLALAEDGTYASAFGAGNSSGTLRIREVGHWRADGTRLVLTPESANRYTRNYRDYHSGENATVECGGPRTYEVTTLALEYTVHNATSRTDGLQLEGPVAPWYYSGSGNFSIVLRRTGEPRAKSLSISIPQFSPQRSRRTPRPIALRFRSRAHRFLSVRSVCSGVNVRD